MAERSETIYLPLFESDYSGLAAATVSRHGGCSKAPFDTNNISFGVGDDEIRVAANRAEIKRFLGLTSLASAHQVHGASICQIQGSKGEDITIDGYDALITDQVGVGLLIGHADCQAVVLYDPVNRAVGAVHSGWRGSVQNITAGTIGAMTRAFGTRSHDIIAAVSPSLGPCCAEFINHESELPERFRQFQVKDNYFDFWQITRHQLLHCGVKEMNVFIAAICTSCSKDYFSYRRAVRNGSGVTGRNGSLIALV